MRGFENTFPLGVDCIRASICLCELRPTAWIPSPPGAVSILPNERWLSLSICRRYSCIRSASNTCSELALSRDCCAYVSTWHTNTHVICTSCRSPQNRKQSGWERLPESTMYRMILQLMNKGRSLGWWLPGEYRVPFDAITRSPASRQKWDSGMLWSSIYCTFWGLTIRRIWKSSTCSMISED